MWLKRLRFMSSSHRQLDLTHVINTNTITNKVVHVECSCVTIDIYYYLLKDPQNVLLNITGQQT